MLGRLGARFRVRGRRGYRAVRGRSGKWHRADEFDAALCGVRIGEPESANRPDPEPRETACWRCWPEQAP